MQRFFKVDYHISQTGIILYPFGSEIFDVDLILGDFMKSMNFVEYSWQESLKFYRTSIYLLQNRKIMTPELTQEEINKINLLFNRPHVFTKLDESYPEGSVFISYLNFEFCGMDHHDITEFDLDKAKPENQRTIPKELASFSLEVKDMTPTDQQLALNRLKKEENDKKKDGMKFEQPSLTSRVYFNSYNKMHLIKPAVSDDMLRTPAKFISVDVFFNPAKDVLTSINSFSKEFENDCAITYAVLMGSIKDYITAIYTLANIQVKEDDIIAKKKEVVPKVKNWLKSASKLKEFITLEGYISPEFTQKMNMLEQYSRKAQDLDVFNENVENSAYDMPEVVPFDMGNVKNPFDNFPCFGEGKFDVDCKPKGIK